jgi:2-oxoglutarate ferredoxin oxidoreductase subunit delta
MAIKVEWEWCKGCGICIIMCPAKILKESKDMNKKGYFPPVMDEADMDKCNNCRLCELICPDFAIGVIIEDNPEEKEKKKAEVS